MSQSTAAVPFGPVADTQRSLLDQPGLPFAQYLPAEQIHDLYRQLGLCFRDRLFSPAMTMWTFLGQVLDPDPSCRQAVARYLVFRCVQGLPPCSADTGAYCRARARLPQEILQALTRQTGRRLHQQADPSWLWHQRQVKIVDGTGLSMPDTPENQKEFPQPEQVAAGVGFPLLRLVVVFSLAVGTVLDAAMGKFKGKGTGEVSLFRSLDVLEPGDVLLADRLYANFWDVARARDQKVDVVLRMHAGRRKLWFRGRGHSTKNKRVWWHKPPRPAWMSEADYQTFPEWLRLRALRVDVRQRGFRTRRLVLVTTLLDAEAYPAKDLADLYRRRWQAELDLRSLKQTLKMDVLRGQTPAMVRKEVWAHLLAYNLVRGVMVEAARQAKVLPEEVSFKGAQQTVNAFLPNLRTARTEEERKRLWASLVTAVARHRVGNRPDRYEPRAVKRRPKNYRRLKEPRRVERVRLVKRY